MRVSVTLCISNAKMGASVTCSQMRMRIDPPLLGDVQISHVVKAVVEKCFELFLTKVVFDTLQERRSNGRRDREGVKGERREGRRKREERRGERGRGREDEEKWKEEDNSSWPSPSRQEIVRAVYVPFY